MIISRQTLLTLNQPKEKKSRNSHIIKQLISTSSLLLLLFCCFVIVCFVRNSY